MLLDTRDGMQPVEDTYHVGSLIQGRYLVEDVLGKGGFGIVYLVRDQTPEDEQKRSGAEYHFALKMLVSRDMKEKERFLFEGKVLMHLNHPALPHIHRAFEEENSHQACVLMDYVEGTNLDILRKRPVEDDLSPAEALNIIAPIVEALSYLHTQPSPIIHRDVKPANVIVKKDGKGAVLVDFGIAKEFELDGTTTAIRHCSPGYGAPEQYSSIGTDQRTDVYGLGATLYALLTRMVPADALQRLTCLASEGKDPLVPINEFIPDIPVHIADAIHRSMSIDMKRRFASIKEFWQALHETSSDSRVSFKHSPKILPTNLPSADMNSKPLRGRLAFALLLFLLLGSLAFAFGSYFGGNHGSASKHVALSPVHRILTARPAPIQHSPVTPVPYPALAQAYQGKILDMLSNVTTTITLTHIEQKNNQISGFFSGMHMQGTFTGVLDASRHIFFTVSGQPPLFFEGAIRSDGNLVGNYCDIDSAGQCVGNYGIWGFAPV